MSILLTQNRNPGLSGKTNYEVDGDIPSNTYRIAQFLWLLLALDYNVVSNKW